MSDKHPTVGLDVNELAELGESNKPTVIRLETSIEGSGTTQLEKPSHEGKIDTSAEPGRIHRGLNKRALSSSEKQTTGDQAEHINRPQKKPKSEAAETYIPTTSQEPSILKSKETKSAAERELGILTEGQSSVQQVSTTVHDDLKSANVAAETETHSQSTSETTLSRLLDKLLEFPKLFDQDTDRDTLLHLAIVHHKYDLAHATITAMVKRKTERNYCGLDIQNNLRQAPIHLAVITCQPLVVKYLAENGADVNSIDRNGQTALHLACKNADLEDVRAVRQGVINWQRKHENIEKTIDVNVRNFEGLTPIHLATLTGSCEVLHELLEMGANVNLKDSTSGRTALHHAVEAHNPVAVRFLLARGANVNAQTFSGNTPLHTASGRHMDVIISLLLDYDADARLANAEGDPPLPETHRLYSRAKMKR